MSKYVKNLITGDLSQRLDGVEEAVFVNVIGLDANQSVVLRKDLRKKISSCWSSKTAWQNEQRREHRWLPL